MGKFKFSLKKMLKRSFKFTWNSLQYQNRVGKKRTHLVLLVSWFVTKTDKRAQINLYLGKINQFFENCLRVSKFRTGFFYSFSAHLICTRLRILSFLSNMCLFWSWLTKIKIGTSLQKAFYSGMWITQWLLHTESLDAFVWDIPE